MDFGGVLSMDGFSSSSSYLKHGRSDGDFEETQDLGFVKMARTESKDGYRRPATQSLFPEGAQMLSFSTPVKDINGASSPYYYYPYQSVNELSMNNNGVMGRVRGPFTPSQWMELEHQALIYKYIVQNAPVPTTLLVPIRRSLNSSSLFSPYSSFTSAPLGWGSLQVGYPYNSDPELGRCRRTDGKKWRCSRDAVPDQKYCERHINRGRHRSRKHVEPQRSTPAPAATRAGGGGGRGGGGSLPDSNLNRILTKETTMTNPTKNPFKHTNAWIQQSRSNTTNLSIAIPVCSSDFSSSASPNNRDNMTLTPLNWGASLGGPLGEVLNNTSNNSYGNDVNIDVSKDDQIRSYALPPSLNLLRDGWDLDLGHNLGSSPTDVLKNNFGSVSSSNASSPRPEIGAVCHDLIGSAVVKPHSITLL